MDALLVSFELELMNFLRFFRFVSLLTNPITFLPISNEKYEENTKEHIKNNIAYFILADKIFCG